MTSRGKSFQAGSLKLAIGFAVMGILGQIPRFVDPPPSFDRLERIAGTCEHVDIHSSFRGSPTILVGVRTKDGTRELRLDTGLWFKRFGRLRPGNDVQAWVAPDAMGRNTMWIWQISTGDSMIVSYDESAAEESRSQRALGTFGLVFLAIAVALGSYALLPRPSSQENGGN